jgi:hypothetical protein
MKKKNYILTLFALVFISIQNNFAQTQIPNAGFENWTDSTHAVSWNSINEVYGNPPLAIYIQSLKRTTDKYTGNYAAKLQTVYLPLIQTTVPGFANLGNLDMINMEINGGIPINAKPTKFKGWYKYNSVSGDTMMIAAVLYKFNQTTGVSEEIGYAMLMNNTTVSNYTKFEIDFTYDVNVTPDTIDVILLSSASESPKNGSALFVDDLELDYTPQSIVNVNSQNNVSIFPNPANDHFVISNNSNTETKVSVYNMAGQKVINTSFTGKQYKINTSNLKEGVYFVHINSQAGDKILKLVIKHSDNE